MPAILNRGGRISSGSFPGSRSSLGSHGFRRPSSNYGSNFSLRRTTMNNGSSQSSSHSLRNQSLYRHQTTQQKSTHNAVWYIKEDQGSATPSLVSSETSVASSSQSSRLQQPPSPLQPTPLHTHPTSLPPPPTSNYMTSPQQCLTTPTNGVTPLPNEEDEWGQFVDTFDAEEDLARRCKLISISRRNSIR